MTRTEYLERHRYQLAGLALDMATVRRDGAELALQMRTVMARVDAVLGSAWDDLHPKIKDEPTPQPGPAPKKNERSA